MRKMQSVVYASVQPLDGRTAGRTEAFVPLCESAYARRQINEQITHNTMQWQWRRRAAVTCDLSEKPAIGCVILCQCYRLTQPPREGVKREPGNTEGATLKDGVAAAAHHVCQAFAAATPFSVSTTLYTSCWDQLIRPSDPSALRYSLFGHSAV